MTTAAPTNTAPPTGGAWRVEEFTKNTGSVGAKKIVFFGASYKFVHKCLRDMLLAGGFNDVHLMVHDLDPEPLKVVGDLLERIARQQKTNVKISRTLDRREALKNADAVILSITTGGRESDQRSWEVCAKYGVPVCVGDTLGPAALARNLRTVPVVLALGKEMEELCPNAVLLNFTNPMSVLTSTLNRYTAIPTYGLCHSADELWNFFARVFNVKKTDLQIEVGGVNHQAFVSKLLVKGVDQTNRILEAVEASDAKLEDNLLNTHVEEVNLQKDMYRIIKAWPSTGSMHLAEFYHWFVTPRRIAALTEHEHLRGQVIPGRKPFGNTPCPPIIREWAYGPAPVGDLHLMTTEHAHELLWASFTNQPFTRVLNVLNTKDQLIKGLPADACVEVLVTVKGKKFTGKQITLPPVIHSLVQRWTTIHDLSIKAALECDRDAARQALFLDPHVTDLYDIDPMLEDFLTSLEPWLPKGWFKK